MQRNSLLLISLLFFLLSCKEEPTEIEKPVSYAIPREYPTTYAYHGDSITIHRQYVSEWIIDSQTFKRIPHSYKDLPSHSYSIYSTKSDSIHAQIDSFNHRLLATGALSEIPPSKISVDDTIPFWNLYKLIFEPIMEDLRYNGVIPAYPNITDKYIIWKDLKLNIKPGKNATAVTLYFYKGSPRLRVFSDDTTFDARLTKTNAEKIIRHYRLDSKVGKRKNPKDPIGILVSTNNDPISSKEIYDALYFLDTDSMWFRFTFDCNDFKPTETLNYRKHTRSRRYGGKPIIYLYPEKRTDISVQVDPSVDFTFTYPHYPDSGWRVTAEPSGTLRDPFTGKSYYSLFWEGYINYRCTFDSGFVVPSNEIVSFLEEKLTILGLNFREAQEFILYWAPVLEQNEYSLIHFATDEYAEAVPLKITPKPDTEIRVLMNFKATDASVNIPEQQLAPHERNGYTIVEWGGSNYDTNGPVK